MKKIALSAFIFLDLALIGGSGFVLFSYIQGRMPVRTSAFSSAPAHIVSAPVTMAPVVASTSTVKAAGANIPLAAAPAGADAGMRKILFTYRNPHAKQVSIRADFTGWKAEPMIKAANGNWNYQAPLSPGEYAYCYTADDKTFKDPANKRTKQIGRTLVSAILVEAKK